MTSFQQHYFRLGLALLVAVTGLAQGASLLIHCCIVPFWRSVPSHEYRAWFQAHGFRIGNLMLPLGLAPLGAAIIILVIGWKYCPARNWLIVSIIGLIVVALVTKLGNLPINNTLVSSAPLTDIEIANLLKRWILFNSVRLWAGFVVFLSAIAAMGYAFIS